MLDLTALTDEHLATMARDAAEAGCDPTDLIGRVTAALGEEALDG